KDGGPAPAPLQQLRATDVERRLIVLHGLRPDQLVGRQLGDIVLADLRGKDRPVQRTHAGELQVERLRVEAFDGDVEVVLQRERDGVVEGQIDGADDGDGRSR